MNTNWKRIKHVGIRHVDQMIKATIKETETQIHESVNGVLRFTNRYINDNKKKRTKKVFN